MDGHYSMFNRLAMEKRMKCNCGACEFCEAKVINLIALEHLSSLMKRKEVTTTTVIANKLLNPGKEEIEDIIASTDKRFTLVEIEQIKSLAEKLRNCRNEEEVKMIILT